MKWWKVFVSIPWDNIPKHYLLTVVLILGGFEAENDLNLLLGVKRKTSEPRVERMGCEGELFCVI